MTAWLRETLHRLGAVLGRRARDAEFEEELASHLDMAAAEFEAQGLAPEEARRRAAHALGGLDATRERHRDARGLPHLESLVADLRYGWRRLRQAPGFALAVITILAVGIGANTAIFSVVNAIVLRPLPFDEADRLVWIARDSTDEGLSEQTFRVAVVESLARDTTTLDAVTTYFPFFGYYDFILSGRGDAQRLAGMPVGPNFFEMLGVVPAIGRTFTDEEVRPNGPRAVLLTHASWQRTFAADPAIVGRSVTLSETPYTVIGVLPARFDFASTFMPGSRVDMFVPADYDGLRNAGNVFFALGRLRPGVTLAAAQAELDALMPRISATDPGYAPVTARLTPLAAYVNGPVHRSLILLWFAVGLVLLIACANLSGLLMARTSSRSKEVAVRLAIGASRIRIMRQMLTENLVLALFGAALGLPLAQLLVRYVKSRPGLTVPLLHRVEIDGTALLFTAGVAVVTSVAFGLLPAIRVAAGDPQQAMREQTRGSTHGRQHAWFRSTLLVVEIAVACVLLVGAGLLLRTFLRVQSLDLGFAPAQVVSMRLNTRPQMDADARSALLQEVLRRVEGLPGVEAVSVSDSLPLDRNRTWGAFVPGRDYGQDGAPLAFAYIAGPGYFRTMGIELREGREFSPADRPDREVAVIVNDSLAQTLYPGQSALGREFGSGRIRARIVGVVRDVRQTSLEAGRSHQMYFTFTQQRDAGLDLLVRTRQPLANIAPAIRRTLGELDPGLSATDPRTLDSLVDRALSPRRFLVALFSGFSVIALMLACVGIYSTVAFTVGERAQEFGVRLALGASAAQLRSRVVSQTMAVAAIGVAVGALLSLVVAQAMTSLLYETSSSDAVSFGTAAVLLTGVAGVAAYLPARRASRLSPMAVLRQQ